MFSFKGRIRRGVFCPLYIFLFLVNWGLGLLAKVIPEMQLILVMLVLWILWILVAAEEQRTNCNILLMVKL